MKGDRHELCDAGATYAAKVYIPDGSADQVIVVDGATGVFRRIEGLEAVHGPAGAATATLLARADPSGAFE